MNLTNINHDDIIIPQTHEEYFAAFGKELSNNRQRARGERKKDEAMNLADTTLMQEDLDENLHHFLRNMAEADVVMTAEKDVLGGGAPHKPQLQAKSRGRSRSPRNSISRSSSVKELSSTAGTRRDWSRDGRHCTPV